MKVIKRWTTTVAASFDWLISQVENHDALIASAIRDMQQAGAKAKVQLNKVRKDGEAMRRRVEELREMEIVWKERAIRVHQEDENKALECVQRRKQLLRDIKVLEAQIGAHSKFETQLTADLKVIEGRVAELKRKKNALKARQYRAEAMRVGQREDIGLIAEIDEIFDSWEMKLEECEGFSERADDFEEEFRSEEEQEDLRTELEQLLQVEQA